MPHTTSTRQHVNKGFSVNAGLLADFDRLERLWAHGAKFKSDGPWLFGEYSIADCMFAPVAVAIQNYFLRIQPLATNAQSRVGPKIEPFDFRSAWSMIFASNSNARRILLGPSALAI